MNKKEPNVHQLKAALFNFIDKANAWLDNDEEKNNKLTKIRPVRDYRDSDVWAQAFADDLAYFERLADTKNIFNGVKNALIAQKLKDNGLNLKTIELTIELAEAEYWKWENLLTVAKQRLKFYEGINYTYGNATFGSY